MTDRAYWAERCHLSGEELARQEGGDGGNWRKRIRKARKEFPDLPWRDDPRSAEPSSESTEIRGDGTYYSERLLRMNSAQSKDPAYLLEAHGFDVAEWELVSAKSNVWNVASKRVTTTYWCNECHKDSEGPTCGCGADTVKSIVSDGHDISTLYSSKITAKPRSVGFDIEQVVTALKAVKPVAVPRPKHPSGTSLLEIPPFDAHFGISDLDYYRPSMTRILQVIRSRHWSRVLFPIGSDLFHADNLKDTTSNGTKLEHIDFTQAWSDAFTFYCTLIDASLRSGDDVDVVFVRGNHCESMSWAFCNALQAKYPQVTFDLSLDERKVFAFESVCIGLTHGDKARKDIDRVFLAEFPEFSQATIREIHTGHYHHESSKDEYGVMVRVLSTGNRTDQWSKDNGYVGANKRFMLFDYSCDALERIHYV